MVRIGIGMFGLADKRTEGSLKSVVTWKSVVSQIKEIQVGESVGYNRSFIASRNQTIAIVPVGYGDGFPRSLSNGKGCVYIQNHPCPTVGMVCMDMLMIDVTGLEVEEGDSVILFENNAQLSAFAAQATTIPYEILTSISQRIHRTYISE
jgi:alanine racemase